MIECGCRLRWTGVMMRVKLLSVCSRHSLRVWTLTVQHSLQPGSRCARSRQHKFSAVMPDQEEEPEVEAMQVYLNKAHNLDTRACVYNMIVTKGLDCTVGNGTLCYIVSSLPVSSSCNSPCLSRALQRQEFLRSAEHEKAVQLQGQSRCQQGSTCRWDLQMLCLYPL